LQGGLFHREFPFTPVSEIWVGADIIALNTFAISRDNICQGNRFNCETASIAGNKIRAGEGWLLNQELHNKLIPLTLAFWEDLVAVGQRDVVRRDKSPDGSP
jgi:hypothetical protein